MKAGSDIGKATEEIFNNTSYLGETPTLSSHALNKEWDSPYAKALEKPSGKALEKITTCLFATRKEIIESGVDSLHIKGGLDSLRQAYTIMFLEYFTFLHFALNQNMIYMGIFGVDLCTRGPRGDGCGIIGLLREISGFAYNTLCYNEIKGKNQIQDNPIKN